MDTTFSTFASTDEDDELLLASRWLSPTKAAEFLEVEVDWLFDCMEALEIPYTVMLGKPRFDKADLNWTKEYLDRLRTQARFDRELGEAPC